MKIATFNINGINRRLDNLLAWLEMAEPDVVCLQELKARQEQFPAAAIETAGYGAVWVGEPRWNGVAILARDAEPIVTSTALPGDPADRQSRYIEAAVGGILIASLSAPNGNPRPGPKFEYELAWTERLISRAAELMAMDVPVVLAGDYNIVPEPRDIYPTRSYDENALLQPESRALYQRLLDQGWTDALCNSGPSSPLDKVEEEKSHAFNRSARHTHDMPARVVIVLGPAPLEHHVSYRGVPVKPAQGGAIDQQHGRRAHCRDSKGIVISGSWRGDHLAACRKPRDNPTAVAEPGVLIDPAITHQVKVILGERGRTA